MAQLVERSLLIPEVRGSNPVIGKKLFILNICLLSTVYRKDENKEKRPRMAHFLKTFCKIKKLLQKYVLQLWERKISVSLSHLSTSKVQIYPLENKLSKQTFYLPFHLDYYYVHGLKEKHVRSFGRCCCRRRRC